MVLMGLAFMIACGYLLARVLDPGLSRGERAALAYPLGYGVVTQLLLLLSFCGVPLRQGPLSAACLLLLAILHRGGSRAAADPPVAVALHPACAGRWERLGVWGLYGVLAVLAGAHVALNLLRPGAEGDAIDHWDCKARIIADAAAVDPAQFGPCASPEYPLGFPLGCAWFHIWGSPSVKLINSGFYIAVVLWVWAFLSRWTTPYWGVTCAVLLASTRRLFAQSLWLVPNFPVGGLLLVATAYHWESTRAPAAPRSRAWLACTLLGLAAWTRPEAAALAIGILLVACLLRRKRCGAGVWKLLFLQVALLAVLVWPGQWLQSRDPGAWTSVFTYSLPVKMAVVWSGACQADSWALVTGSLLTNLLHPTHWALLGVASAAAFAVGAWRDPAIRAGAVLLLPFLGLWYALWFFHIPLYSRSHLLFGLDVDLGLRLIPYGFLPLFLFGAIAAYGRVTAGGSQGAPGSPAVSPAAGPRT